VPIDEHLPHLDGSAEQARRLEVDRGVVEELRPVRRVAAARVVAVDADVRARRLGVAIERGEGLGVLAQHVALQAIERRAEIRRALAGAERARERVERRAQLGDTCAARLVDHAPEHVERVEVEVRGVDRELAPRVALEDVAEERRCFVEAVRLVVEPRAPVLDGREVVRLADDARVARERLVHPLFERRERASGQRLALDHPSIARLEGRLPDAVVAEHGGERRVRRERTGRLELDHAVERGTALVEALHLP
jgi:hypothetical protein